VPAVTDVDDEMDYNDPEITGYQSRLASLRAQKGEVLLSRLPNMRLLEEPCIRGVILRGPASVRVAWDAA
jgi:hypothetical protein